MDNIIYCSDTTQLKQELIDNGFIDGKGNYTHGMIQTPAFKSGLKSLSLVRDFDLDLTVFKSLTNLGTYEEVFADITAHDLYKSVWAYHIPIETTLTDGTITARNLPERFAEFSGGIVVNVPKAVTMRQARLALLQSLMLDAVQAAITAGADEAMKIEWEYATEIKRDWESLIALTTAMGLTSEQLDDLFILAGGL